MAFHLYDDWGAWEGWRTEKKELFANDPPLPGARDLDKDDVRLIEVAFKDLLGERDIMEGGP